MSFRAVSLLYHDVVPDGQWASSGFQTIDANKYKLTCNDFRAHLQAIAQKIHRGPATARELLAGEPADFPFLITFDDGGVSAAEHIAGMLDELGWKGHFLVTGNRIGTRGFLDRSQIVDLHRRGHIIGSHSHTHPLLMATCSPQQLFEEWSRSGDALAEILGEPIHVASIPGGQYSHAVAKAAAKAGIRLLFNSEPTTRSRTLDGCLILGRFSLKRGHPASRSAAIVAGNWSPKLHDYAIWNSKKIGKRVLGDAWLRLRSLLQGDRRKDAREME